MEVERKKSILPQKLKLNLKTKGIEMFAECWFYCSLHTVPKVWGLLLVHPTLQFPAGASRVRVGFWTVLKLVWFLEWVNKRYWMKQGRWIGRISCTLIVVVVRVPLATWLPVGNVSQTVCRPNVVVLAKEEECGC